MIASTAAARRQTARGCSPPGAPPRRRRATAAGRSLGILVLGVLSLGSAALAIPTSALAASSTTTFDPFAVESPFMEKGARFAERVTQAGDLTGDGVPDIFVSSYVLPVAGKPGAGRVLLYSGADRSLVYTLNEPGPQTGSNFGFYINVPGDLNGDGKDDLLVGAQYRAVYVGRDVDGNRNTSPCGAPEPNGCNERQGRVYAFDGASGRHIFSIDDPNPQPDAGFGGRLAGAGDVTGDGFPDILVGAPLSDVPSGCALQTDIAADCRRNEGEAFVFNGVDGSLIRQLNVPASDRADPTTCTPDPSPNRCGNLGGTVQSPGDIDRDGVPDQIVAADTLKPDPTRDGRVYLFSGKSGAVLARIDQPAPDTKAFWGLQDIDNNSPGDVTGDGVPDIYEDGFLQDGASGASNAGRAWIFDGRRTAAAGTGVIAREVKDPSPAKDKSWGFAARRTDYNKDGFSDLLVTSLSAAATQAVIVDGRDDSTVLKTLEQPAGDVQPSVAAHGADVDDPGPTFGQGLAAPGDLNGDGEPDYVVAAPFQDVSGTQDQGRLYFFVSNVPPVVKPPVTTTGKFAAKMSLARARLVRSDRVLDVLAPITSRASGRVKVELYAAGQRFRFTTAIDSANGRIRFRKRIPKAQADMGTGIITIEYAGDADTKPQTVRLRAAAQKANLNLSRPTIVDGRLKASGTISDKARGVVRVQVQYDYLGQTRDLSYQARINHGKWKLDTKLSPTVLLGIAARQGTVHSYTLFTGYLLRRMRGEMRSFQVLGDR